MADELLKIVGSALGRPTPEELDERRPESPLDD
jgi:hypothetical protein